MSGSSCCTRDGRARENAGLDRRVHPRDAQAAADLRHRRNVPVLHPVDVDREPRTALAGLVDPEAGAAEVFQRVALAGVFRRGREQHGAPERDPPVNLPRQVVADRAGLHVREAGIVPAGERAREITGAATGRKQGERRRGGSAAQYAPDRMLQSRQFAILRILMRCRPDWSHTSVMTRSATRRLPLAEVRVLRAALPSPLPATMAGRGPR